MQHDDCSLRHLRTLTTAFHLYDGSHALPSGTLETASCYYV
jgi:hypothetical protein